MFVALNELSICSSISAKGVVIHVGKSLTFPIKDAIKNSKENILHILKSTTNPNSNPKLLFETCCGAGTEMFAKIEDFIKFVKEIMEEDIDSRRFGIVVDTCHVFAAGYDPYDYMIQIINAGLTIDLIHLNNSKDPKGSHKDHHEHIESGKGCIERSVLDKCILLAEKLGIDCVIE